MMWFAQDGRTVMCVSPPECLSAPQFCLLTKSPLTSILDPWSVSWKSEKVQRRFPPSLLAAMPRQEDTACLVSPRRPPVFVRPSVQRLCPHLLSSSGRAGALRKASVWKDRLLSLPCLFSHLIISFSLLPRRVRRPLMMKLRETLSEKTL